MTHKFKNRANCNIAVNSNFWKLLDSLDSYHNRNWRPVQEANLSKVNFSVYLESVIVFRHLSFKMVVLKQSSLCQNLVRTLFMS